LIERRKFTQK